MKSSSVIRDALVHYKGNELIFASQLYKEELNDLLNEATYYKMLERMCKSGELVKVAKGIYCIPVMSRYGVIPPSENQIIEAFIKNDSGTVIGYRMYNQLNLTTQVSKTVDVLSSALDGFSKTVRNIKVKQLKIDYNNEVKNMICVLEVLQNFYEIQDLNYSVFIEYSQNFAQNYKDEVFDNVILKISYKKSTISFLKEILNYYGVSHHLDVYLSSLSTYKHPRMEELYEIARKSRGI